jgi:hypothetical protein
MTSPAVEHDTMSAYATTPHRRLRSFLLTAGVLTATASPVARAHEQSPAPSVVVREIRVDRLLIEFGVDTAQLRRAVVDALRAGNRLAGSAAKNTPALDIAVTTLRNLTGAELEPTALLSVEVGRNLMEDGTRNALVWERRSSLRSYPTWRALSDNTPGEVLRAVRVYVDSLRNGP